VQDLRIVFLGTSAGTPTPERNMAAVAMAFDGRALLFDCGEGTQYRLQIAPLRAGAIEAIFITHLHGDHLFGLPGLLASLGMNGRSTPLHVYGPAGLLPFLQAVPYPGIPYPLHVAEVSGAGEVHRGDGYRVLAAPVEHSAPCFAFCLVEDDQPGRFDLSRAAELGVPPGPMFGELQRGASVTLPDGRVVASSDVLGPTRGGRRIVYCTDTRPCAAAAELARGADVLIHEATYDLALATEAKERFHATAAEAAEVAKAAGVRQLILTHFSPRYTDIGPLVEEARAVFAETEAAADLACVAVERHL
jgi:ribonuclease Z